MQQMTFSHKPHEISATDAIGTITKLEVLSAFHPFSGRVWQLPAHINRPPPSAILAPRRDLSRCISAVNVPRASGAIEEKSASFSLEQEINIPEPALKARPEVLPIPAYDGFIRLEFDNIATEDTRHFPRGLNAFEGNFPWLCISTWLQRQLSQRDLALEIARRYEARLRLASSHLLNGIKQAILDTFNKAHQQAFCSCNVMQRNCGMEID